MLDDKLNKIGPIARDLEALYKQKDEVKSFIQRRETAMKKKRFLPLLSVLELYPTHMNCKNLFQLYKSQLINLNKEGTQGKRMLMI